MRRTEVRIAAWAVAFRCFSAAVAFVTNVVFPKHGSEQFASPFGGTRAFWVIFTRYDSGWLFQIARHKIADQLRRRYRESPAPLEAAYDAPSADPEIGRAHV